MTFLSVPINASGEAPLASLTRAPAQYREIEERLPFTVRLVRSDSELRKAVHIRQSAYARHLPEVARNLEAPEAVDTQDGVAVLLAESKLDGSPLGTVRLQTNATRPLALEQAIELPSWLQGKRLAHVSRLGVAQGHTGRLVRLMLFKGLFIYLKLNQIDWAVVAAREPLDRMYEQLLFQDVYPGEGFTPCPTWAMCRIESWRSTSTPRLSAVNKRPTRLHSSFSTPTTRTSMWEIWDPRTIYTRKFRQRRK